MSLCRNTLRRERGLRRSAFRLMQHKGLLTLLGALAVVVAAPAASAPPAAGVVVPGVSLGGVELGMSREGVLRIWGPRHGICRDCEQATWYFNYRPFAPEGVGVSFRRGRVDRVFTVWKPSGWRAQDGLNLGASASEVEDRAAILDRRECAGYSALLERGARATTAFYLFREELWGVGLIRPGANPCL